MLVRDWLILHGMVHRLGAILLPLLFYEDISDTAVSPSCNAKVLSWILWNLFCMSQKAAEDVHEDFSIQTVILAEDVHEDFSNETVNLAEDVYEQI